MYRPFAKVILAVLIAVTTVVSVFIPCASEAAAQPVKVFLSGRQVKFDVPPVVDKGGILVPARAIFEAFGATVDWDQDRETVSAYKDGTVVRLILNEPHAYVNSGSVELAVPPKIINGRVVVPVRFVGEVFGAVVSWDDKNSAINISFKQPVDYKNIRVEEVSVFAENLKMEDLQMLPDGRFLGEADILELDPRRITDPFYVVDYDNIPGYTYGTKMLFLYDVQEKTVKEIAYFDWEARGNQAKYWNFTYLSDGRVLAQNSIKPDKKARDENYVYKLIDPYTGETKELFTLKLIDFSTFPSKQGTVMYDVVDLKKNQNDLYTINLEGTVVRHTYNPDVIKGSPLWSPDGGKAVYVSYPKYGRWKNPYISIADFVNNRTVTFLGNTSNYAWSPDSKSLAYHISYRNNGRNSQNSGNSDYGIWTVNADGSGKKRIWAAKDRINRIRWSPDGGRLVADLQDGGFIIMNRDGTELKKFSGALKAWSPDSRMILYTDYGKLWLHDLAGDKASRIFSGYVDKVIWENNTKIYILSSDSLYLVTLE